MKGIQRRPYLIPHGERLVVEEWELRIGDQIVPINDRLPGWDPGSDLHIRAEVLLDVAGIFNDCRLAHDARLRLGLLWASEGTKLRDSGSCVNLGFSEAARQFSLTASVGGHLLAGTLTLLIKLLFLAPGSTRHLLIPRLRGSVLLETPSIKIHLEGTGPRFPTEVIDFAATRYPQDAGWYLDWNPEDLHQPLLGDVRLYINSRHQRVAEAASKNTPEAAGIREAVRLDLAHTLIRGALSNDDFVENPGNYEPGTIGAAVRAMIRLYFESYSFAALKSMAEAPHEFSANLQEKLKIFTHES